MRQNVQNSALQGTDCLLQQRFRKWIRRPLSVAHELLNDLICYNYLVIFPLMR